jgi:hypothetical protein
MAPLKLGKNFVNKNLAARRNDVIFTSLLRCW